MRKKKKPNGGGWGRETFLLFRKKKKPDDRDVFGTPTNRANTWGEKTRDPKKNRRLLKDMLRKNKL